MSTAQESVGNYFDAARKFMDTWVEVMQKALSGQGVKSSDLNVKGFGKMAEDYMNAMEKMATKQAEMIDNLTPEEFQKQSLQSLQEFEKGFNTATQQIQEMIKKEEEYIQSDQFLADTKENATKATSFYNTALDGFSKLLNTYTDTMKSMANS